VEYPEEVASRVAKIQRDRGLLTVHYTPEAVRQHLSVTAGTIVTDLTDAELTNAAIKVLSEDYFWRQFSAVVARILEVAREDGDNLV
jgi:DNA-binding transcriptional ArsR family regulator